MDVIAANVFARHGAWSAPALVYGFPGTVLVSVNDEVVHGVPGARRLQAGDIVKFDVTAEKGGYMADAARTVVLENGTPTTDGLSVCVQAAFEEALSVARAGVPVREIGRAIASEVRRRGYSVVPELGGHGIGRTIHEAPVVANYYNSRQTDMLTEGLVIAIEPIVCSGSGRVFLDRDGWTIRTKDRSLAAHYENTVVITRDRPILLTAA